MGGAPLPLQPHGFDAVLVFVGVQNKIQNTEYRIQNTE